MKNLKKTAKKRISKNKTYKKKTETYKLKVVNTFIEMINLVKLYHWKTKSYAKHQATDELFEKLNKHTDQFVEVLIGKDEKRIKKMNKCINVLQAENDKEFKSKVYKFREFLTNMNDYFHAKKDSDLLSIRDEILADINQFLYLMTFDK
tara:strand:- start:1797 stop:2243 length:447 start_codon:yes stop_codon:yes gene_type:complete